MFEHFGIYDALKGLWKHKVKILLVTVLCGILGVALVVWLNYDLEMSEEKYLASGTYYVEFTDDSFGDAEDKNAATTLNTVLDADFCMQFVTDYVLDSYGEAETKKMLDLGKGSEVTYEMIPKLVKHSVLADGNSVNLFLNSDDQKFAETVVEAYDAYVSYFVKEMGNVRTVKLGGVRQGYLEVQEKHSLVKFGIIGAMGGFVLGCIVIFCVVLFCPVINRESDLEEYGVRVFGKI